MPLSEAANGYEFSWGVCKQIRMEVLAALKTGDNSMNQAMGEIGLFVGKITFVLASALTIFALLRNANPRWQVQACRLTGLVLLICGLLSATRLSNVWGPSLAQGDLLLSAGSSHPSIVMRLSEGSSFTKESAISETFNEAEEMVGKSAGNLKDWNAAATPNYSSSAAGEDDLLEGNETVMVGVQPIASLASTSDSRIAWPTGARLTLLVWVVVAFCLASLRLLASYQVHRIVIRSAPLPEAIASACSSVTLRPRLSSEVSSPTVVGCWRPIVLLPAWMHHDGEYADSDLRAACAHEQAHVENSDLIWIHLLEWLSICLWFHPLLYVLKGLHRTTCERVADSNAAAGVGGARHYAACLARVALKVCERPNVGSKLVAMIAMVAPASRKRSSGIAKRLEWVRESRPVERLGHRRFGIALGALAAAIAIGTLGIVEAPLAAAPPVAETPVAETPAAETQEGNPTSESNGQRVTVVQPGSQQNIQLTTLGQVPTEQERPGQRSEGAASVYNAIVSAPPVVPVEDKPVCIISVTGVVRDESGGVLPGVHVALIASLNRVGKSMRSLNPIVAQATTNADGTFLFNDIESVTDYQIAAEGREDWWRIVAIAPDGRIGWENVRSNSLSGSIQQDVTLSQSTHIEAQVVDERAQPVIGASIDVNFWAQSQEYKAAGGTGLSIQKHGVCVNQDFLKMQTDAKGRFKLDGVPIDAIVSFTVRHPSMADKVVAFATTDDPLKLDLMAPPGLLKKSGDVITCEAGTLIRGKVVDESEQGLKASVAILGASSRPLAFAETQAGEFSLRLPPDDNLEKLFGVSPNLPATYTLVVRLDDEKSYASATANLAVAELETASPINLMIRRRFEFSGRVVDSDGQGISGVGILARSKDSPKVPSNQYLQTGPAQPQDRATTDAQGFFKVWLPEGSAEFLLSGRVPGFDLVQHKREVDEQGHLLWWPDGLKSTHTASAQVSQNQLSPLVVRKIEPVNVRVVGPSGAPLAGAQVNLLASPGNSGAKKASQYERQLVPIAEQVITDGDGRCRIVPFALPDYTAAIKVVSTDSSRPSFAEFRLEKFLNVEEELRRGLEITTQPALYISGRVTVEGEPLDKIWINVGQTRSETVASADSKGHQSQKRRNHFTNQGGEPIHVRTNAEGVYEAWVDAKKANWGVSLNAGFPNDYQSFPVHEVENSDPLHARVDIDLKRGTHALTGKVVDQAGAPIPRARVRMAANAWFDPATSYEATTVTTGFDGSFHISGLPVADSYSLYAEVQPLEKETRTSKSEIVAASSQGNVTIMVNLTP